MLVSRIFLLGIISIHGCYSEEYDPYNDRSARDLRKSILSGKLNKLHEIALRDFERLFSTGKKSFALKQFERTLLKLSKIPKKFKHINNFFGWIIPNVFGSLTISDQFCCGLCWVIVKIVKIKPFKELCARIIREICYWIGTIFKKLFSLSAELLTDYPISGETCFELMKMYEDAILYILKQSASQPLALCGILLQSKCHWSYKADWSLSIPKVLANKKKRIVTTKQNLRVLHFTDIHYDIKYKVNGNADCGEPTCCGEDQGTPMNKKYRAGYWGDYRNCDTPWHTMVATMKHFKKQKFDLIYFTGDIVDHFVWTTSIEKNTEVIRKTYNLFKRTFPKNFYPVLGNHESHPINLFSPLDIKRADLSPEWLFNLIAEEWSFWLPNSTMETIRKGGYYTVLHNPKLRIVGLNNNVAYTNNFWLTLDDYDTYGQLRWLIDTLKEAERHEQKVHILSHCAIGSQEHQIKWSFEYRRILKRYQHVIAAEFNGHTHFDELNVVYENNKPIHVVFNGGSLSNHVNMNSNYKIYFLQDTSYRVHDFESWIFNLTLANIYGRKREPVWYRLYSFKNAFGVNDMTNLNNMDKFVKKLSKNDNLLHKYWRFMVKNGDPSLKKGCDKECKQEYLCNIVTSVYKDNEKCKELVKPLKKPGFFPKFGPKFGLG